MVPQSGIDVLSAKKVRARPTACASRRAPSSRTDAASKAARASARRTVSSRAPTRAWRCAAARQALDTAVAEVRAEHGRRLDALLAEAEADAEP